MIQPNDKFGYWKVLERTKSRSIYRCLCTGCNKTTRLIRKWNLLAGQSKSCGCNRTIIMKQTNQSKYGIDFVQQNVLIKQKRIATMIKRYGVKSYPQTSEYHTKRKITCLKKYQAEHHMKSEQWKMQQRLPRYGCIVLGRSFY